MPQAHCTVAAAEPPISPIYRPALILSPWQHERNHAGKDFFIIVNRLLTIANGASSILIPLDNGGRNGATLRLNTSCEQELASAYGDLTTGIFRCLAFTGI
jgi:hypothetical protein